MSLKNSNSSQIMRAIILDHYEHPKNLVKNANINKLKNYCSFNTSSPSCIDNLTAYLFIKDNKISDIKFSGVGCAISTSSTDIMSIMLINKTLKQALNFINNYLNMIDGKEYDSTKLNDLLVYKNVNKQINRINCAKVGIIAIKKAIEKYEKKDK